MSNETSFCCKGNKYNSNKEQNLFCEVVSEYSANTTIHGIPYFADNKRTWVERLWWALGFIASCIVCLYLISRTWIKWQENPVIVSFAQEHSPVWEIPFPAVTICPLNKINQHIFNYTEFYTILILENYPDSFKESESNNWDTYINRRIDKFWGISLICDLDEDYVSQQDSFISDDIIDLIREVAPKINETLRKVMWQNKKYDNNKQGDFLFHTHVTSEGLCFTFNALGFDDMYTKEVYFKTPEKRLITHDRKISEWSIESGYKGSNFTNSYPERTTQAGLMFGLSAELLINASQRDGYCGDGVAGFKVLLHNPAEIPRLTEQYFLAPAKQQVTVAVTPLVIRTSTNLVDVPPHSRNCYFAKEKQLRFFQIYTQYNCKTECEANITREYCGCLPFFLPRDRYTKICGIKQTICLSSVRNQVFKYENMLKNNEEADPYDTDFELFKIFKNCDCLASCNTLDYEVELSQAEYLYPSLELSKMKNNNTSLEITPINIFFKESQFLALERGELYGQTDFIANIGGLLGLFMGFSFLSFLEIIYYLTLRMWCKYYQKKNETVPIPFSKPQPEVLWVQ